MFRKRTAPQGNSEYERASDGEDSPIEDAQLIEILEPARLGVAYDLNGGSSLQESANGEQEFIQALVRSQVALDFAEAPE